MGALARVLIHPSRLSEATPSERLVLSFAVLALTIVVATAAGALSSRWARARVKGAPAMEGLVTRTRRAAVLLLGCVGAYFAVETAPLPEDQVLRALGGFIWVVGAIAAARLLVSLVALLLTTSVAHVSGSERARLEREYVPLAGKVTTLAVVLIFIIVVLKHFGQDVTSLVAALGVGSLAIGLAAQQTLGNMISGFTILVDRPFRPGDRIKLATGEAGEVMEIGVRSTRILLGDRNLLIVPNTELANSRVVNFAAPHRASQVEVKLTVAYGANVDAATALLQAACADDKRILTDPLPGVRVAALGPLGVELVLGAVIEARADAAAVEEALRRRVLKGFAEEKIELARASR